MKVITIAGRIGKSAELRRTQSGDPVLSFPVAVDDGYGQNKSTIWFDCSVWGKRGEALERHLTKGTPVTVSGELGRREHEGKTYLTVRVNDVAIQGKPSNDEKPASAHPSQFATQQSGYGEQQSSYGDGEGSRVDLDDEIPFIFEWRG